LLRSSKLDGCWGRVHTYETWEKLDLLVRREMPMPEQRKDRPRAQSVQQPSLFQPTSPRPTWASLPPDVQQIVTKLLARILREARERSVFAPGAGLKATGEEDTDE
jgi:hypothetical protein